MIEGRICRSDNPHDKFGRFETSQIPRMKSSDERRLQACLETMNPTELKVESSDDGLCALKFGDG